MYMVMQIGRNAGHSQPVVQLHMYIGTRSTKPGKENYTVKLHRGRDAEGFEIVIQYIYFWRTYLTLGHVHFDGKFHCLALVN